MFRKLLTLGVILSLIYQILLHSCITKPHGILEFKDIPYGTYKAVESDDIVFEFFDMMSIENVNGVTFKKEGKTGYITINPTGEDIIYGAKIINKIKALISNPKTIRNLVYVVVCLLISYFVLFLFYKNIIFYKR